MYMHAFLPNLLAGRFFGEGTASADFRANNPRVCGNLFACVKISALGDFIENLAFTKWDLFNGSNYVYTITITTNKFFNVFLRF